MTYQEEMAAQQRRTSELFERMSRMPSRPKPVTPEEMAAFKKSHASLYKKGGKN